MGLGDNLGTDLGNLARRSIHLAHKTWGLCDDLGKDLSCLALGNLVLSLDRSLALENLAREIQLLGRIEVQKMLDILVEMGNVFFFVSAVKVICILPRILRAMVIVDA
jgi:hypothetical protein